MNVKCERNRVFAADGKGEVLGEVTFPDCENGHVVIDSTFVKPELRGQRLASDLMRATYNEIKAQDKKACLRCPYAIKWFDRHPQAADEIVIDCPAKQAK